MKHGGDAMNTKDAYEICHTIIKQHSKTFAKAFSTLPQKKRQAVWAIYAFCRTVDDIVDEGQSPSSELELFEDQFNRFIRKELPLTDPKWIALDDVFQRFEMDTTPFFDMMKGQRMDLYLKRYETLDEVEQYSYHVASTVGLMLLPVLAPNNHQQLHNSAIALGKAMQLTNILRDIGEDLNRDRIYLPQAIMDAYDVAEKDLLIGERGTGFINMWEHIAARAEDLYQEAFKDMYLYPVDARIPVQGAGMMYRAILKAVRLNQYNVFSQKSFVPKDEKEIILNELKA